MQGVCGVDHTILWGIHSDHSSLLQMERHSAYGNMIRYDPTLVDLTSNFVDLCTNIKVYLCSYS